jgi:hypothetical protein
LYMSVIPAPKKLRQEDHEFEVSLGYMVSSRSVCATKQDCLKNK